VFLAGGELVALCDSYYPAGLAQRTQIAQDRRIRGEVRAVIEDQAGPVRRRIACSFDDLASRTPRRGRRPRCCFPRASRSSGCCGRCSAW
jgi:GntR family transcriptional regulator